MDCSGTVLGIDTALLSSRKVLGSIGTGFAIPSSLSRFVVSPLLYPGADRTHWIGVKLQTLTSRLAMIFGRPDMAGATGTEVTPGSPAAAAIIKPATSSPVPTGRHSTWSLRPNVSSLLGPHGRQFCRWCSATPKCRTA